MVLANPTHTTHNSDLPGSNIDLTISSSLHGIRGTHTGCQIAYRAAMSDLSREGLKRQPCMQFGTQYASLYATQQ